jgi:HNH endonuclease
MKASLEQLVWRRARDCCEYCLIPQSADALTHHIDHIIAEQHGGETIPSNLALACYTCNLHKGPNLAGRDPRTRKTALLFHPRRHSWGRHFRWHGALLIGRTAIGRATVATLAVKLPHRVELRETLIAERVFPPMNLQ